MKADAASELRIHHPLTGHSLSVPTETPAVRLWSILHPLLNSTNDNQMWTHKQLCRPRTWPHEESDSFITELKVCMCSEGEGLIIHECGSRQVELFKYYVPVLGWDNNKTKLSLQPGRVRKEEKVGHMILTVASVDDAGWQTASQQAEQLTPISHLPEPIRDNRVLNTLTTPMITPPLPANLGLLQRRNMVHPLCRDVVINPVRRWRREDLFCFNHVLQTGVEELERSRIHRPGHHNTWTQPKRKHVRLWQNTCRQSTCPGTSPAHWRGKAGFGLSLGEALWLSEWRRIYGPSALWTERTPVSQDEASGTAGHPTSPPADWRPTWWRERDMNPVRRD